MNTILLTSLIISLFCVGLRIISSKGMILYFLRKPYELIGDRVITKLAIASKLYEKLKSSKMMFDENFEMLGKGVDESALKSSKDYLQGCRDAIDEYEEKNKWSIFRMKIGHTILKPIIGCCTCMASVWTIVWMPYFEWYSVKTILIMLIVAAFNSILITLFDVMSKHAQK